MRGCHVCRLVLCWGAVAGVCGCCFGGLSVISSLWVCEVLRYVRLVWVCRVLLFASMDW